MQTKNKTIRRLLRRALAIAMATALAAPALVMAGEGEFLIKKEAVPKYTCSSKDAGSKGNTEISLKLDGLNATGTSVKAPAGADAHFEYFDDGIRYEGKPNQSLSIYEGCTAYLYAKFVPGYKIRVGYTPESVKSPDAYDHDRLCIEDFQDYVGDEGDYALYRFRVPEKPITIIVTYVPAEDVQIYISEELDILKSISKEPEKQKGPKVPFASLCTLPDAPEDQMDDESFRWIIERDDTADYSMPIALKPGESFRVTSNDVTIAPMNVPMIDMPDYLEVTESEMMGYQMLRIGPNLAALKKGEQVEITSVKGYSTLYNGMSAEGSPFDAYGGMELIGLEGGAMCFDGFYLPLVYGVMFDSIRIRAKKVTGEDKETVLDFSDGSYDFAQLLTEKDSPYQAMGNAFALGTRFGCDFRSLYADRLGEGTEMPYFLAFDLNGDGDLDLRSADDSKTFEWHSDSYYDALDVKVDPGSEVIAKKFSFEMLRMKGAENFEKPEYSFESGMAKYGKVTFKLFDSWKVTFKDGDKVLSEEKAIKGKPVVKPADPVKEGFTFKGWQIENGSVSGNSVGGLYTFKEPVNSDLTLKAVWEKTGGKTEPAETVVGKDVGTKLTVGKIVYVVTKQGNANNMPEVSYSADKKNQGKKKTVKVPDTITVDGVTYKVTALEKNALANEKKAKTIILGKYIKSVPAKAVKGCKKLKTLKVTNTDEVVKLNKKSLTGTKGKIKLMVPKAYFSQYKKQIKKLKLTKKVTLKKY